MYPFHKVLGNTCSLDYQFSESKRISLHGGILCTNSLRDLGHGFVVLEGLGVLELVEVVHDPVV